MFSSRLPPDLAVNALSRAVAARRASGPRLLDLTETNPTAVGIPYPADLLSSLADARGLHYQPDPRGLLDTRRAVARTYGHALRDSDPARVVLTASTSEAYAVLFKLLCDAGDDVLVPQPSYPLFEHLTAMESIRARPYRLEYHGVWSIDRDSVKAALTPRARALLVVSPNNPTGSRVRASDREWLVDLCAARGLAIVSDEVFSDYPLRPRPDAASFVNEDRVLTFVLGGLSKSVALPQLKLAWMIANGPGELVDAALQRLDVICDAYLSVATPVQVAAPTLLERGRHLRAAVHSRIARNLDSLRTAVRRAPAVALLEPEGGWSAVLRVPATRPEEAIVLDLLHANDVLVHPGYFFDFPHEAFLVLSLLPDPEVFDEGAGRVLAAVSGGTR